MLCFDIEKPVLYIFYADSDTYLKLSTNSWNIKHNLFNKKKPVVRKQNNARDEL